MVCKVIFKPQPLQPLGFLPIARILMTFLPLYILFLASRGVGDTVLATRRALPLCAVLHDNAKGQPNHEKTSDTFRLRDILPKLDQYSSEMSTPLI